MLNPNCCRVSRHPPLVNRMKPGRTSLPLFHHEPARMWTWQQTWTEIHSSPTALVFTFTAQKSLLCREIPPEKFRECHVCQEVTSRRKMKQARKGRVSTSGTRGACLYLKHRVRHRATAKWACKPTTRQRQLLQWDGHVSLTSIISSTLN